MKTEELFVTYNQAKELKELGIKCECFGNYWILAKDHSENKLSVDESKIFFTCKQEEFDRITQIDEETEHNVYHVVSVPLKTQIFSWFRKKHNLYADISTECTQIDGSIGFSWWIWKPLEIEEYSPERKGDEWSYETYEQAESECIDKLISILKEKQ